MTLVALIQEPAGWEDVLSALPEIGLEGGTLLLSFTLAIFAILVFAVRFLLIRTGRPVPTDPFDMPRPRQFRALMILASALLAPLVAESFLPIEGLDRAGVLLLAYGFEALLAVVLWLLLEAYYRTRRPAGS